MSIAAVIPQLRTTNLKESIDFYTEKLGFEVEFQYEDFYAGIKSGDHVFHLKLVDEKDPGIDFVDRGEHLHLYFISNDPNADAERFKNNGVRLIREVHDTPWRTTEFAVKDNQGHTLYFGQNH